MPLSCGGRNRFAVITHGIPDRDILREFPRFAVNRLPYIADIAQLAAIPRRYRLLRRVHDIFDILVGSVDYDKSLAVGNGGRICVIQHGNMCNGRSGRTLVRKNYNIILRKMDFIKKIKEKARGCNKTIVLPEGTEERTLKAADAITEQGIANVVLIGDPDEIRHLASEYYLENIDKITIIDPRNNPKKEEYIDLMVRLRGDKGVTREVAAEQLENPQYLGAVMVKAGDADGEVSGAGSPTSDVLRPALQYVKTAPGIKVISGTFIMHIPDTMFGINGLMLFADCAVHPDPSAEELAEIAVVTGHTARDLVGIEPKIAMLSFSTKGSASHPMVDKVVEATKLAQEIDPTLMIDGELQADSATVPGIAAKKAPQSPIGGRANVLVFPSLDVGNIAYKLVQRMAHAQAIGPVLQGMAAPVNDLSRGCSVEDIVDLVAITACQATTNTIKATK